MMKAVKVIINNLNLGTVHAVFLNTVFAYFAVLKSLFLYDKYKKSAREVILTSL